MTELGAIVFVALAILAGLAVGIRFPIAKSGARPVGIFTLVGFTAVSVAAVFVLARSVIISGSSGVAVLSHRLGFSFELASNSIGYYLTISVKLLFVFVSALCGCLIIKICTRKI